LEKESFKRRNSIDRWIRYTIIPTTGRLYLVVNENKGHNSKRLLHSNPTSIWYGLHDDDDGTFAFFNYFIIKFLGKANLELRDGKEGGRQCCGKAKFNKGFKGCTGFSKYKV
jgi:hypothetical protein